ncbi:hypothetical protein Hanom_Chr01g00055561 [Helianthus anomalus]
MWQPSLHGFRSPKNLDEYLKLKAKQAKLQAKYEGQGENDSSISSRMQLLLSKVKKLEDYARDLSKEMSNLPPNADLQKEMGKDLLELIMRYKLLDRVRQVVGPFIPSSLNTEAESM